MHAIPAEHLSWPALFKSEKLLGALDDLHGGGPAGKRSGGGGGGGGSGGGGGGERRWAWLRGENLGAVHIRYSLPAQHPVLYPDSVEPSEWWHPPTLGWHIDGGQFNPHHLCSRQQSVIVLPVVTDVCAGGGGTVVLKGSHRFTASRLRRWAPAGLRYMQLFLMAHLLYNLGSRLGLCFPFEETAPAEAGARRAAICCALFSHSRLVLQSER